MKLFTRILLLLVILLSGLLLWSFTKNEPVLPPVAVPINNNDQPYGLINGAPPTEACGSPINLEELETLGNYVNFANCPTTGIYKKLIVKPYMITMQNYSTSFTKFDRKTWLYGVHSAYGGFLDWYQYLANGLDYTFHDQSDIASMYVDISYGGAPFVCIGPDPIYMHQMNNDIYTIKGNQMALIVIRDGSCEALIKEAEKNKVKIVINKEKFYKYN